MKSIFKPLMLVTVLATAGFIGACNDDNDTPTSPSSPSPTPPAATPEPTTTPSPTTSPEPSSGPEPGVGETIGFLGYVRDIQGTNLNVSSKNVAVNSSTQFVLEDGSPWSLAAVQLNDHVRVRGTVRADGFVDAESELRDSVGTRRVVVLYPLKRHVGAVARGVNAHAKPTLGALVLVDDASEQDGQANANFGRRERRAGASGPEGAPRAERCGDGRHVHAERGEPGTAGVGGAIRQQDGARERAEQQRHPAERLDDTAREDPDHGRITIRKPTASQACHAASGMSPDAVSVEPISVVADVNCPIAASM